MRLIAHGTKNLTWNRRLLGLLLEELHVDDLFFDLVGPRGLPTKRYPQAVAIAVALRHSWRPDDLFGIARKVGIRLRERDLKRAAPESQSKAAKTGKRESAEKAAQPRSTGVSTRRKR